MTICPPHNVTSSIQYVLVTETFAPEINGVAMTLGKIVNQLVTQRHRVCVVRPRQSAQAEALSHDIKSYDELKVAGFKLPFYRDLRIGLPAKNRLIQAWTLNRPDVVHIATEGPLGWSALKAAQALKIPVVSSYHTNFHQYSKYYGLPWLKQIIAGYLRNFHNQTAVTVVPTHHLANHLRAVGYRHVDVRSRGVSRAQFNPSHRNAALRASWGVTRKDLVVLYVGRLAKEKNIPLVIEAFNQIKKSQASAKLVFVGDGPLRSFLAKACPDAIFAGSQTGLALAEHYASGDLFLFPSVTETFGNVVPEALASGLCVVAYDAAAAADLIEDEISGLLVPFDQPSAFIKKAVQAANDQALLKVCRTYAELSVASLDWSSIINHFQALLYKSLSASRDDVNHDSKLQPQSALESKKRLVM
jgi:glycosyltransferase involved in cell wall biosynthesis